MRAEKKAQFRTKISQDMEKRRSFEIEQMNKYNNHYFILIETERTIEIKTTDTKKQKPSTSFLLCNRKPNRV